MRASALAAALLLCAASAFAAPTVHISDSQPPLIPRQIQQIKAYMAGNLKKPGGTLSQTFATLGREDLAAKLRHPGGGVCLPLIRAGKPVSLLPYISKAAAKTRAVIINEAHDVPQGRTFIADLGHALQHEGYSLYGAETFSSVPVLKLSANGHKRTTQMISLVPEMGPPWPMRFYGFYVQEPTFGKLLRTLRGDRYRFFAYDATPSADQMKKLSHTQQINLREKRTMANIAAKLKAAPKRTKILLHVSDTHADERPGHDGKIWLGQRFRAATGINPLTISQTNYTAPGDTYVVCDPAKLKQTARTDITLGAPRERFRRGRPVWRLKRGEHFFDIPAKLLRPTQLAVYRAIYAGEPDGAVAADQILLRPGEKLPLLLPTGKFRLTVWTAQEGWSKPVSIRVNG